MPSIAFGRKLQMQPVQLCDTLWSCVYVLVEILARSSLPARVSDKRLKCSIKLLPLCKDAVTINIYSLAVIELVKTMCCPAGPVHFGRCTPNTKVSFRCTYDKRWRFAKWLYIRSVYWQWFGKRSISRRSSVQAEGQREGRCWLGADAEKQRKSDNAYTRRSSLASESSCFSIRRWWLDVRQSFSSGRRANVSTAENDRRGKVCERRRLCVLSFVCTVCITFNLLTAERCYTFTLDMMLIHHSHRQNCCVLHRRFKGISQNRKLQSDWLTANFQESRCLISL